MQRRLPLAGAGAALALLLTGCNSGSDAAKSGVTPQEAQALNDAAAMLDDNGQDAVVESNASDNAAAPENAQ